MSHVWGQTVPSNYGRLPATRQKVFNADEVVEQIVKQFIQETSERISKEVTQELQGKLSKEITEDIIAEAKEKTISELGEDTSQEAIEALYKKNLKGLVGEVTEEVSEKSVQEVTQKTVKETVAAVPESVAERLGKRAITVGGIGVTGFAMFNSLLNSDALDDYVSSTTGRDCDEKAVEAGYEPGTQEYTDRVNECQEKAVENMAFLGKAMTYGGLGLATLVVVSVLGKMGIFSGSGSKEESDDEE